MARVKDGAGVAEISAHPVGGRHGGTGFYAEAEIGGYGLEFVGEGVIVAALAKMDQAAGGGEEIESALGFGI